MKNLLVAIAIGSLASSCALTTKKEDFANRDHQISAYLYFQRAGEYKALMHQAYNAAKIAVEADLSKKRSKKRAVVFDIDETLLDNSYAGAYEIKNNIKWNNDLFGEWTKLKTATALPGALEFYKYLLSKNVEPIFISNRLESWKDDTYENLVAQGFNIKKENVILMGEEKSKESRRIEVAKKYDIILLIGDNLIDFDSDFDKKSMDDRNNLVEQKSKLFGTKYIILPNPMYGDWENSLPKVKDRKELLKVNP